MESWNFVVRGLDSNSAPKFIGQPTNTKGEAEKLRKSAETIGWRYVAVYDASLTEVKGDAERGAIKKKGSVIGFSA